MTKVMFLCTGNTCRSQMAEGFARELGLGLIEPYSAGLLPAGLVHPAAIAVMNEEGIDISGQSSKGIAPALLQQMDIIVTLCSNAEESCPVTPPEITRLHWPIDDPVNSIEEELGTEEEDLNKFRKARDEIKRKLVELVKSMEAGV
ncbi:MAG: arsenate reductase ArsC [Thermodesulfovibrionales bacterium]